MSFGSFVLRAVKRNLEATKKLGMTLANSLANTSANQATQNQPRLSLLRKLATVGTLGTLAAGSVTAANAEGDAHNREKHQSVTHLAVNKTWTRNRLQSDICHMAPGISEVLLDILDLLQENCDNYLSSMRKRVSELESDLQKYGSTISLNLSDEEMESFTLTDQGSREIQNCRREYRSAHQKCNEMVAGLEKFLLSAQQFGAKTCIENCQREVKEVITLLNNTERQVIQYERKLSMTEKHFYSRKRRAAVGHSKMPQNLKEQL